MQNGTEEILLHSVNQWRKLLLIRWQVNQLKIQGYISDNVADEVGETVEMNDGTTKRVIDVTNMTLNGLK